MKDRAVPAQQLLKLAEELLIQLLVSQVGLEGLLDAHAARDGVEIELAQGDERDERGASQIGQTAAASGVANLPPEAQAVVLQAFVNSFHDMFLLAIPFALAAFVVALFLKEAPMDRELAKGEALE